MVRITIVGFGQLGRGVLEAIKRNDDMELSSIITRRPEDVRKELDGSVAVYHLDQLKKSFSTKKSEVAILCVGSKDDVAKIGPQVAAKYNTVCSFDIHEEIEEYSLRIRPIAEENGKVYMLSNGFDPGFFSLIRFIGDAVLPESKIYTFYGPGVSQGHSNAARSVSGVKDAKSYTMPVQESVDRIRRGEMPTLSKRQMIWRKVFVVPKKGADTDKIRSDIVGMPLQFDQYYTEVHFISQAEMEEEHHASPHGGFVIIVGVTGNGNKQIMEYSLNLESNPEFTSSVLVAFARAAFKMSLFGHSGAFVAGQTPLFNISPLSPRELLRYFM